MICMAEINTSGMVQGVRRCGAGYGNREALAKKSLMLNLKPKGGQAREGYANARALHSYTVGERGGHRTKAEPIGKPAQGEPDGCRIYDTVRVA